MIEWLEASSNGAVGDPGRIHVEGMTSRAAVEQAREQVAALFGARPREVVFCSGATEAIGAASWGAAIDPGRHVVCSAVEHSAVREWARRGPHSIVGVDGLGRVDADALIGAVTESTGLVHLQWGNHEVGTLQPVEVVAARPRGDALLHVDAAQAAGRVPIAFTGSGIDLLSVSAHKLGGPTGVGALLVRRGVRIEPLLVGGDQERARRAGLESVASIIGFGAAAAELADTLAEEQHRARRQTERVIDWARHTDGVSVLGDAGQRLPHLVCVAIEDVEPQPVLLGLDRAGVAVHSGSSCSSEALEPSPVLEAMGVDAERSLRISVGWSTTDADIDRLLDALPRVLGELRALGRG
jgi:cysteine desulfurase